ncbi:MAG: fimbrillin family protein [Bacteroidales bacterium]|nr:fimbrillin family protein [Bacteroidales bacterium]
MNITKILTTLPLAMALVGCSDNNNEIEAPVQGFPIEFSQPFTGKQSRILGEITNDNLEESQFKVWGWTDQETTVFDGKEITFVEGEGWTYSPKELWDTERTYDYVAIAPSDNIGSNLSVTHSGISISGIPFWQEVESATDYLVSEPIQGITYRDAGDGLQFTFHHILAKLQVKARCTIDDAISGQIDHVDFSQFQILCTGPAEYSYSASFGTDSGVDYDNQCWNAGTTQTAKTLEINGSTEINREEYQLVAPAVLIAPTPAGWKLETKLKLGYNVWLKGDTQNVLTFDLDDTDLPSLSAFHQGYVTTLYLNIRISNSSLGLISAGVEQKVVEYDQYDNKVDDNGNPNF